MDSSRERIVQAERRLGKIEALQQLIEGMDRELTAYRETLTRKLDLLHKSKEQATATMIAPKRPAPTPTSAPQRPAEDQEPGAELRTSPRRKGNPVPVLLNNANATLEPFQGWVLDRSAGGLRILVDQQVTVGAVLSVKPTKVTGTFPWIQVKVRSCTPERSSWNLGVQFVQKLAWGEMQAFG